MSLFRIQFRKAIIAIPCLTRDQCSYTVRMRFSISRPSVCKMYLTSFSAYSFLTIITANSVKISLYIIYRKSLLNSDTFVMYLQIYITKIKKLCSEKLVNSYAIFSRNWSIHWTLLNALLECVCSEMSCCLFRWL